MDIKSLTMKSSIDFLHTACKMLGESSIATKKENDYIVSIAQGTWLIWLFVVVVFFVCVFLFVFCFCRLFIRFFDKDRVLP